MFMDTDTGVLRPTNKARFGGQKIGDQSDASHTRKQDLTLDQEQDQNTTNTKTWRGTTVQ